MSTQAASHQKQSARQGVASGGEHPGAPLRIDRYELLGEIARGGMGTVYRARDKTTGEECALKCVHVGERRHAALVLEGFEREYQVLRGLKHPRIIRVYDYGVTSQGAYYTMELLEGGDLRRAAPLPWREVCQYLRDIATCFSLLHARRLIHRDLSPGNVKRTGDGHCKLIDFGALSEFGQTDTVIGTPPFIAPEVLTYGRLDQRVDLYALGALGYYCLTGQHAYPAAHINELPQVWQEAPAAPSQLNQEVPPELDSLLLSLLSADPLARPSSAAEVIARLDVIAQLQAEEDEDQRLLVQSFLAAPRYVGREGELARLTDAVGGAAEGRGQALRVYAPAGAGRTRFLEEAAIHAQLAGAVVVRADASVHRGRYGTLRALANSLLQALPYVARTHGHAHRAALVAMDPALEARLAERVTDAVESARRRFSSAPPPALPHGANRSLRPPAPAPTVAGRSVADKRSLRPPAPAPTVSGRSVAEKRSLRPPAPTPAVAQGGRGVEDWFIDVSREHPLVVLVDNVEYADDASLGALLALARAAPREAILLVMTEQADRPGVQAFGFGPLYAVCETLALEHLSRTELAQLVRSIFGETPRAERLADWLHEQTMGSPLYCMGLLRQLVAQGAIRYERGLWVLPSSRPETQVAEALEDALGKRLDSLSFEARELAQCLSLQRLDPTLELCRRLVPPDAPRSARVLLDELVENDIVHLDQERCVFSSAALRRAVLRRMKAPARRTAHAKLGRALFELASENDRAMRIEAGWHLIRGGEEMRGAEIIAQATQNSLECNVLVANLYRIGEPVEAALKVYRSARKSRRERLPLLNTLAQAGYYEHYRWAERYGDDALDVAEQLSGLGYARRLRPFLGSYLALAIGLGLALLLHYLAPRKARGGSFINLLTHVCSTVTSLSGVAAISLDPDRCDRVAELLSPVRVLPKRLALVGIHEFCSGLQHIAREHQAEAFSTFDRLAEHFKRPGYYLFLPPRANLIYASACHFARGAFAMMRADGSATLESADELERSGWPLYMMIASQLRYLYHLNRGELSLAQEHRERVEMHAARAGSAWQVELWEPAALMPFYIASEDVVELARIAHRLAELAESIPSMWRYRELAYMAAELHARKDGLAEQLRAQVSKTEPRSFIGWSTAMAGAALSHNQRGEHAEAYAMLKEVVARMNDRDREYVMIFLLVDLQMALAEAGLGQTEAALRRLDHLLALIGHTTHAFALGLVHEMRATVALAAGLRDLYEESTREAARWLRSTHTPTLVARCERLERLGAPGRAVRGDVASLTDYVATGIASSQNTRVIRRVNTDRSE